MGGIQNSISQKSSGNLKFDLLIETSDETMPNQTKKSLSLKPRFFLQYRNKERTFQTQNVALPEQKQEKINELAIFSPSWYFWRH